MIRIIVDDSSKEAVLGAHRDGRLHAAFGDASYRIEEGWPEGPGYMRTIAGAGTAVSVTYHTGGVTYLGGNGGTGGSSAGGCGPGGGAGGTFGGLTIGGGGSGPDPSVPLCPHCGASGGGGHGGGCPNA